MTLPDLDKNGPDGQSGVQAPRLEEVPLDRDLACMKCGYNLRTRLASERCPECNCAVAESIGFEKVRVGVIARPRLFGAAIWFLAAGQFLRAFMNMVFYAVIYSSQLRAFLPALTRAFGHIYWIYLGVFLSITLMGILALGRALGPRPPRLVRHRGSMRVTTLIFVLLWGLSSGSVVFYQVVFSLTLVRLMALLGPFYDAALVASSLFKTVIDLLAVFIFRSLALRLRLKNLARAAVAVFLAAALPDFADVFRYGWNAGWFGTGPGLFHPIPVGIDVMGTVTALGMGVFLLALLRWGRGEMRRVGSSRSGV